MSTLTLHLAKHLRDVHFGGNWTVSNVKDTLEGVTWQQAVTKVPDLNTIAALTYHINYFVRAALDVLHGRPLLSKDMYSFDHPPVQSEEGWKRMVEQVLADALEFASLVEQLPEEQLWEAFVDSKYGNYYRNIQGIIEHTHYHLGQIALVKKMIMQNANTVESKKI